jgi:photosynthetic reaction center cytochrome c subunit
MKLWSRRLILVVAEIAIVCLVGVALAASGAKIATRSSIASRNQSDQKTGPSPSMFASHAFAQAGGQAAPAQKTPMAEEVFKNVQVLKGIPVDEFMGTMGIFSAALSMCCAECHTGASTDTVKWEADTPRKRTARKMVEMVSAINRTNFGGRQVVTCWTCHRGRDRPVVTPTLDSVYGSPVLEPDDILTPIPGMPSADQIFDKYIQALGGAARLASLTSYVARGTSVGFGSGNKGRPVEIYAKAPNQRATIIHTEDGDIARTFDGRAGSIMTPLTVVKDYDFSGGELEGARLDAQLAFPERIKEVLRNWRVNNPSNVNDREVQVVQGGGASGLVATLYFDKETGLLARLVRYANSAVGRVPTQVDYADYRPVAGVMIPFRWTFSWLDGRDEFVLAEVQPNVPIDAAKFVRPAPGAR